MPAYVLTSAANNFLGTSVADVFSGTGGGIDTLSGAAGADTFTIDMKQTGTIDGGSEVDTVNITDNQLNLGLSFSNVEVLNVTSGSNLYATAAQLSAFSTINVASGLSDFYFALQGQGGAVDFSTRFVSPTLLHVEANGSNAAVQLTGTAHADYLLGSDYNDTLNGGGDADKLVGGKGSDILNGGTGADVMQGGVDNDTYYVDNAGDIVDESGNFSGGVDIVHSSNPSINLSDAAHFMGGVENVILDGGLNLNATGNDLNNALTGNSGINSLSGGKGVDVLDGKAGADIMDGGADSDVYYVDNAGDKVIETAGNGNDTVFTTASYKLSAAAEVEVLRTFDQAGSEAINLTGSDTNNLLLGNAGVNVLDGRDGADNIMGFDGADILKGGLGSDLLNGGAGNDQFVFNTSLSINNVDTISDFTSAGNADVIVLDDAIFSMLTASDMASGAAFVVNTTGMAGDADDRIIYQSTTGKLFYDADGTGTGEDAVQFATLTGHPALAVDDFLVV